MAKELHNGPKQEHPEQDPSSNRPAAKIGRHSRAIKHQHYKFSALNPHTLNKDAISYLIRNDAAKKTPGKKGGDNTDRKLHMIPLSPAGYR